MKVSIIVKTRNGQRHLPELMSVLKNQNFDAKQFEILVVDSGSTDGTLAIADASGCKIVQIAQPQLTPGGLLNAGCEAAQGRIVVFLSQDYLPTNRQWLQDLITPIQRKRADYVYGQQRGGDSSRFSDKVLFKQFFPDESSIPQDSYFCSNHNAAMAKSIWKRFKFNESIPCLEDLHLAKEMCRAGLRIGYQANASVTHSSASSWQFIRQQYKNEAIALQDIAPSMTLNAASALKGFCRDVLLDFQDAQKQKVFIRHAIDIILFRCNQYYGSYMGGLPRLNDADHDCDSIDIH